MSMFVVDNLKWALSYCKMVNRMCPCYNGSLTRGVLTKSSSSFTARVSMFTLDNLPLSYLSQWQFD